MVIAQQKNTDFPKLQNEGWQQMENQSEQALTAFIENWQESSEKPKASFVHFKTFLRNKPGVILDFIQREGVTYSLRAVHENQKEKELFVLVDVIEDDPRWLSICFYSEMIKDPDEEGDFVPKGLLGEDAVCFDLETHDDALIRYIEKRLDEAWAAAEKG